MLKNGDTLKTRTIILATGAVHQTLGIEGEEKLKGMGVSYCATCDGAFFRNKVTAVVGGGNVALEDAIFLSRMCKKVYLIHRRDEFRGAKILQDEVKKNDKIEILWNTIVTKIDGDEVVEGLHIQDVDNHVDKLLDVDGIFIAVGTKPASELLSGKLSTDEKGYISREKTVLQIFRESLLQGMEEAKIFVRWCRRCQMVPTVCIQSSDIFKMPNFQTI